MAHPNIIRQTKPGIVRVPVHVGKNGKHCTSTGSQRIMKFVCVCLLLIHVDFMYIVQHREDVFRHFTCSCWQSWSSTRKWICTGTSLPVFVPYFINNTKLKGPKRLIQDSTNGRWPDNQARGGLHFLSNFNMNQHISTRSLFGRPFKGNKKFLWMLEIQWGVRDQGVSGWRFSKFYTEGQCNQKKIFVMMCDGYGTIWFDCKELLCVSVGAILLVPFGAHGVACPRQETSKSSNKCDPTILCQQKQFFFCFSFVESRSIPIFLTL